MLIRAEEDRDRDAVHALNASAFETTAEANLVNALRQRAHPFILGHAEYYPRFGFTPSTHFGIGCEYEVPAEVFMALELQSGYLHNASGTIQYHPAFTEL